MCRRTMISGSLTPVSTRIGPAGLPRISTPQVGTRVRTPMLRASTRKLDSTSISISGRSLISWAGIADLLTRFAANAKPLRAAALRIPDQERDRGQAEHGSDCGETEGRLRIERRPLPPGERILHRPL